MTTTMNLNMTTENVMNLPLALALDEAHANHPTATATLNRKPRISWLIPCVVVLAALFAYQAMNSIAAINAHLDAQERVMQNPQF